MNRWSRYMLLLTVLAALCLQGCQDSDSESVGHESVAVRLALSVAKSTSMGATRMLSDNTQGNAINVELRCVIPFAVGTNEITVDDEYKPNPIRGNFLPVEDKPFYTSGCDFDPTVGINKLLAYGRDDRRSAGAATRGMLVESFADESSPSLQPRDIRFSLQPIKTREEYLANQDNNQVAIAQALADYLTSIANATIANGKTWKSDATNNNLKMLYKNFINELSEGVGDVLPGSAANVYKWVTELKSYLDNETVLPTADLSQDDQAIITEIKSRITTADVYAKITPSTGAWKDFPSTLGLPDGAAVVRWQTVTEGNESVEKFVPETQTTTIANINNIERFTYPAEIYYYGNSPTMVSETDLSGNFREKATWAKASEEDTEAVLSGFTEGPVTESTRTVAMRDPLQYGVAQLNVTVVSSAASLPDANAVSVAVGDVDTFDKLQLTGIIVGGQLPVGFDFRPETVYPLYSEADMKFIYDTQFGESLKTAVYLSTTQSTVPVSTLVLQSYGRKTVKLVLEFVNNSQDFKGLNGTVYKGTKFYLVGEITPTIVEPADNPKAYDNRVFTHDYTTVVNVTVSSLAKAYNVLPNLMSPRLEMGIELTPQWEQATTSDVIL